LSRANVDLAGSKHDRLGAADQGGMRHVAAGAGADVHDALLVMHTPPNRLPPILPLGVSSDLRSCSLVLLSQKVAAD